MAETEYTWKEIAKHMASNGEDNWIVIDGIVYDVSKWMEGRKYTTIYLKKHRQ